MPVEIPNQLQELAAQVHDGRPRTETVRTLLSWFGFERRGYSKVRQVRKALRQVNLVTESDFEEAWIDAEISFAPRLKPAPKGGKPEAIAAVEEASAVTAEHSSLVTGKTAENTPDWLGVLDDPGDASFVTGKTAEDPTVGRLDSANRAPVTVKPDDTVQTATTLMLLHDYSQLPVMTSEFNLKGLFSWKSLGRRLVLGHKCEHVRDCMDPPFEIKASASLFEAIRLVVEHDCVLVRSAENKITGIVTTADLSEQLAKLGEPFLLLGQAENHIRHLIIAGKFTKRQLKEVRDPADADREVEEVSDLSLGECLRLLQEPKRWNKIGIKVDRERFTAEVDKVRQIRNDVMHFDPDGVGDEAMATLRRFTAFLRRLRQLDSNEN
jgi:CBS domain-containing protein